MKLLATFFTFTALVYHGNSQAVTLYAASSLTQPLQEIVENYRQQKGEDVRLVFAASSTLARQIANGAPADIYISANQKWMFYLREQKAIQPETLIDLLQNQLVLIAPIHSTLQSFDIKNTTSLKPLLMDGRLALGNIDHVPVGIYAKQALESLKLWSSVQKSLAMSSNTRAALAFVEQDAAPLGIVYATDALSSQKVKTLAQLPSSSHQPINYPMAITTVSDSSDSNVTDFYLYLQSEPVQTLFTRYGFKNAN